MGGRIGRHTIVASALLSLGASSLVGRTDVNESATYEGRVRGDEIDGTVLYRGEEYGWKPRRAMEATGPPQTHVFEPTEFHCVRLNRDSAGSHNRIVPSAVQPRYCRDSKFDDHMGIGWKLDRETGVGMLAGPTERMRGFRVQLQPMLGCVGVAPPGQQAFFTGWPGSWGGNMDYRGVREGTTVYLPVYREGALLFVGDGHALQGDGELNGNALETSMDVEFTVDLVRGRSTAGPRFEDDEYLMASGIAGSLQEAIQQATTELALWLERDYGLSANESNIVLGTSIRYEIAEVVNPHVHIVAKVSKAVLATLR